MTCPHCGGPDHQSKWRAKPKAARAERYDVWRQAHGAPAFPAANDVLCTARGLDAIRDTWVAYHAAEAAYARWERAQPLRWRVRDFFRRPW